MSPFVCYKLEEQNQNRNGVFWLQNGYQDGKYFNSHHRICNNISWFIFSLNFMKFKPILYTLIFNNWSRGNSGLLEGFTHPMHLCAQLLQHYQALWPRPLKSNRRDEDEKFRAWCGKWMTQMSSMSIPLKVGVLVCSQTEKWVFRGFWLQVRGCFIYTRVTKFLGDSK